MIVKGICANNIKAYYMINQTQTYCCGWIHNLNKYWEHDYYYTQTDHQFDGCAILPTPIQTFTLNNLLPNTLYNVEFYSTVDINPVAPNAISNTSDGSGNLVINITGTALSWHDNDADFAFRALKDGVVARQLSTNVTKEETIQNLDFGLKPNPSNGNVEISFLGGLNEKSVLQLIDITGNIIYTIEIAKGSINKNIQCDFLAKGVYHICVFNSSSISSKRLIIN